MVNCADKKQDLKLAVKRISELESLANSLSQSVKEKSVTITHQKAANKVLATRVAELEHKLKVLEVSRVWEESMSGSDPVIKGSQPPDRNLSRADRKPDSVPGGL